MTKLTRRRDQFSHQESWHILYDGVRVGWIGKLSDVARHGGEYWAWRCGLPQVIVPGLWEGSAASFEQARSDFEAAWRDYEPRCSEADLDAARYQEAFTAWKYRMHDTGCKLPTQTVEDRSQCYCGAEISTATMREHILACHVLGAGKTVEAGEPPSVAGHHVAGSQTRHWRP